MTQAAGGLRASPADPLDTVLANVQDPGRLDQTAERLKKSGLVSGAGNDGSLMVGGVTFYPVADMTFSAMLALSPAAFQGRVVRVTDLGRALFESNGTRWKPVNGRAVIGSIDTDATMTGTAETIMFQRLLPAGLLKNGDTLSLTYTIGKSGTAETTTVTLRLGASGTVADALLSGFGPLTASNISAGLLTEYTRVNATSVQKLGSGANNNAYGGPSTAALHAPVAVANMDTTPLYLSLTMAQSAAVETATLRRLRLELISSGV